MTLNSELESNIVRRRSPISTVAPIDENPLTDDSRSDDKRTTSEQKQPGVASEVDAEKGIYNQTANFNVSIVKQPGWSVLELYEDTYDKNLSNEMRTFDDLIRNVKTAVSSIPGIHFSFNYFLERLDNLDKKPDYHPLLYYGIVNALMEISHDLNTLMES